MSYQRDEVHSYWEDPHVESMYDKHLLAQEIRLIRAHIPPGSRVLDAGCGEGEGTLEYAGVPEVSIVAADFSSTRLAKAAERLAGLSNVELLEIDLAQGPPPGRTFDVIVSQRFLINLTDRSLQQRVLAALLECLEPGGLLLMLEGSNDGVRELDELRGLLGLPPIPVKWHNLFFDDGALEAFMAAAGCELEQVEGLGAYFLLTRGIRPFFEHGELPWDAPFNELAAAPGLAEQLALRDRFSRLKLWAFRKTGANRTPGGDA